MENNIGIGCFTTHDTVYIFKKIQQNMNMPIGEDVMQIVIQSVKKISRARLEQYGKDAVIFDIIEDITEKITENPPDHDIQGILTKMIGIEKEDTNIEVPVNTNKDTMVTIGPTGPAISQAYIYLDTRYRSVSEEGISEFKWGLSLGYTDDDGLIGSCGHIRDIHEIEIYPFKIPIPVNSIDDDTINARLVELGQYDKITLRIREFDQQSIYGHEDWVFLFEFEVDDDGIYYNLKPYADTRAIFKFVKYITKLSTITIAFGNPLHRIIFDADRAKVSFTGTTVGGIAEFSILDTTKNHNLAIGDVIYFTDFTTTTGIVPAADAALIIFINRVEGHAVSAIPTLQDFEIDVSSVDTIVRAAPVPIVITESYFGSKRIMLKMRIAYDREDDEL